MKKFFKNLLLILDLILSVLINWLKGLVLFLFITIISFASYLIGGYTGLVYFYKNYMKGLEQDDQ